ncbi:MAG: patatin-like phospholipase family protein [Hyphomicrobiaceae bacterium]
MSALRRGEHRFGRLNLALQGGGAHGAFTWGVLDRLLEEAALEIDTISAASAGAVNAVAMLSGLAEGGKEAAKARLDQVWLAISKAGLPDYARLNPFFAGLMRVPGIVSPYAFNPLDLNPLRSILAKHIDFDRLRATPPARLIISATDIATGRARLFDETEIGIDVVLASASLPTLYRAVEIEGRYYWDGGFSANPDLLSLVARSTTGETLLVLLNPMAAEGAAPRQAADIAHHMSRITFNQPLLRDLGEIEARRQAATGLRGWLAGRAERRLARHRFHLISADAYTAELAPESKLQTHWELLSHLKAAGRKEAACWLGTDAAGDTTDALGLGSAKRNRTAA